MNIVITLVVDDPMHHPFALEEDDEAVFDVVERRLIVPPPESEVNWAITP